MTTNNWRDPIDDYYDWKLENNMGWQPKGYSFDAKQARELSEQLDVTQIVEDILTSIKCTAKKGYRSIAIGNRNVAGFEPQQRKVQEELRGLGFQVVMQSDQINGDYLEVSWK